ncbi:hypothetical protein RUM44_005546 [Polyplax serrata]|uniref:Lipase domain-containing protein n=1 Tax=Polyplax serrata TaxID=468196 RepID=A0ABR1ADP7_POLSC
MPLINPVIRFAEDQTGGTDAQILRKRPQSRIIQRLMGRRQSRGPILGKKEICYDVVGCFELPRKPSLKKPPQSPEMVDTKFWLYTRSTVTNLEVKYDDLLILRKDAQLLYYGDDFESIKNSTFNPGKPSKVLIHGFKGSGKDKGALSGVKEFLKLEDVNVLVVDWEKGAADSYSTAVANTKLIGRQTALMLMDMIAVGADPKNIHVIGFSLGAHIAGCAGEMTKQRGQKLGRITGLDPASPLFKHHVLREPSTKLDATKADFVDVIHTDGSLVFTDGFGLLRPIGHVDFFPNGGREQRGCSDGRGSVVVSHFEGTINSSVVCSHVRAWQLFLESVVNLQKPNGILFIAYPCQSGSEGFVQGKCFIEPKVRCIPGDQGCNVMGMGAHPNGARGALYLATRDSEPYCEKCVAGEQMHLNLEISPTTEKTRGYLNLRLKHGDHFTNFKLSDELSDAIRGGKQMNSIGVANANEISGSITPVVDALLSFQSLEFQTTPQNTETPGKIISISNVNIEDTKGNKWKYCGEHAPLQSINGTAFSALHVRLQLSPC